MRWVMAAAVVPLVLVVASLMQPDTPSAEEIEQALAREGFSRGHDQALHLVCKIGYVIYLV